MFEKNPWVRGLLLFGRQFGLLAAFVAGWTFGLHDRLPPIVDKTEHYSFPFCVGDLTDSSPFLPVAAIKWKYLQGGFPAAVERWYRNK